MGPGDDTTALYVGGGGGGGVERGPWPISLGEALLSLGTSFGVVSSGFFLSSWFRTKGGGIVGSLVSTVVGGLLVESDWVSIRGAHGEKSVLKWERSSGFGGGGASSTGGGGTVGGEGVVSLGTGGTGGRLSFGDSMGGGECAGSAGGGGDFGKGGFGSSDGGGDLGNGGAGSAGGGGDGGSGGAGSPSEEERSLRRLIIEADPLISTSWSGFGESSGPKMLSRSAIDVLIEVCLELSSSFCPSASGTTQIS